MRFQELCVNVLLLAGSILMLLVIIPQWTPESDGYGLAASTVPNAMCSVIGLLALFQIIGILRKSLTESAPKPFNSATFLHLCKYFAAMCLIFPAWKLLGFVFGSMAVLALLYLITGIKNWLAVGVTCISLPLAAYALLWYGLHLPPP